MRDLNHLYSEFLVENTIRERRAQARAWQRAAEANSGRPAAWQRLMSAIATMRPSRQEPVCEPAALMGTERGTAS